MTENEINENIKKCPYWERCSMNLCPLDLEINLRVGKRDDMCRWIKVPRKKNIKGREFISGKGVMPNGLLIFVPRGNVKWLNGPSQEQWKKINKHT